MIFLDLLCFSSLLKVIFLKEAPTLDVYYLYSSKLDKVLMFLAKISNIRLIHMIDFVFSEHWINGKTCYEEVNIRLKKIVRKKGEIWEQSPHFISFCKENDYNPLKVREYLITHAYRHLYQPVSMKIMADALKLDQVVFLLKKTNLHETVCECIEPYQCLFYQTPSILRETVNFRKDYAYDQYNNYFYSQIASIIKLLDLWLTILVSSWLGRKTIRKEKTSNKCSVLVAQDRGSVRLDHGYDLYWLPKSGIDPEKVIFLENNRGCLDVVSLGNLKILGVHKKKITPTFFEIVKLKLFRKSRIYKNTLSISPKFIRETCHCFLILAVSLFKKNESNWIMGLLESFKFRVIFWRSIYEKYNIKLMWSTSDTNDQLLTQAQAIECVNGVYLGDYTSNYPLYYWDHENFTMFYFLGVLISTGKRI